VRADRIYNRTMLVKLVRNWRVAVDAFKRDAAIEARVAAKRAEVRGWLEGGALGASLDASLSESLKFLT
jgi:N-acyl-D-aspartate/D-glutamate deacylase